MTFVDTNIWLYALTSSGDADRKSKSEAILEQADIVLSTQVVNELVKNYTKYKAVSEAELRVVTEEIFSGYRVEDVTKEIILSASELREQHRFSYWDSLIVSSALAAGATTLITEDMQHGMIVHAQLTIRNPFVE